MIRLLHLKFALLLCMLTELGGHSLAYAEDKVIEDDAPTPVVGVRGLDKNNAASVTSERDYQAIDRLEKVVVKSDELVEFLKVGNLR